MTTRIAYDVAKNDREDLEGKRIDYITSDGTMYKGIVVGVNRSVGLTIANARYGKDDAPKNLVCFRGPVCSDPTDTTRWECSYDDIYDLAVHMIEEGVYEPSRTAALRFPGISISSGTPGACAYSQ
jgi:hypothetical protein